MKWKLIMAIACLMILTGLLFTSQGHAQNTSDTGLTSYDSEMNCTKSIYFTAAQRKQLSKIYYNIYKDYSQLIEAYAGAGALPTDQKKLRYQMLTNYYNTFFQRNYRWCSEHEGDEWEEEWYNNDND